MPKSTTPALKKSLLVFELPLESLVSKQQIQKYVYELFADGYFDELRTGLKVFKHCNCEFDSPLKPSFVADALGFYTGKLRFWGW